MIKTDIIGTVDIPQLVQKLKDTSSFNIKSATILRRLQKGFYGRVPKFSLTPTQVRNAGTGYRKSQEADKRNC
jgi:hypothetical protein